VKKACIQSDEKIYPFKTKAILPEILKIGYGSRPGSKSLWCSSDENGYT